MSLEVDVLHTAFDKVYIKNHRCYEIKVSVPWRSQTKLIDYPERTGLLFTRKFTVVSLSFFTATALMAGNPTVVQQMIKEHEEHVMEVFRTIDRLANKYNVSR